MITASFGDMEVFAPILQSNLQSNLTVAILEWTDHHRNAYGEQHDTAACSTSISVAAWQWNGDTFLQLFSELRDPHERKAASP